MPSSTIIVLQLRSFLHRGCAVAQLRLALTPTKLDDVAGRMQCDVSRGRQANSERRSGITVVLKRSTCVVYDKPFTAAVILKTVSRCPAFWKLQGLKHPHLER